MHRSTIKTHAPKLTATTDQISRLVKFERNQTATAKNELKRVKQTLITWNAKKAVLERQKDVVNRWWEKAVSLITDPTMLAFENGKIDQFLSDTNVPEIIANADSAEHDLNVLIGEAEFEKIELEEQIKVALQANGIPQQRQIANVTDPNNLVKPVNLTNLNIPKFDGKPENWSAFFEIFSHYVDRAQVAETEKFFALIRLLELDSI
jgi:hypothetical protein